MRKNVIGVAGAMMTSFVATILVWFGVVGVVGEQQAMHDYATQMIGNVLLGVVVGGAVVVYAIRWGGVSFRAFCISWTIRDTFYTVIMALATFGMAISTMLLFDNMGIHRLHMIVPHWSVLVLGVIGQLGVVHEELLFRGYVMTRLRSRVSPALAIMISSVLFVLMHIPFKGAGFMTVSWLLGGLLYGYLYLKSGSLLVPLATHVAHNWTLDLFMYSREGVSIFQFAATRLVGAEKIGFEIALTLLLLLVAYIFYGRGTRFLSPAARLTMDAAGEATRSHVIPA